MGDHVFLNVMPKRRMVRFGKQGKLSSRYIGPFEVLERVGGVAYQYRVFKRYSISLFFGSTL